MKKTIKNKKEKTEYILRVDTVGYKPKRIGKYRVE